MSWPSIAGITSQQAILYTIAFLDCIIWGLYTPILPSLHGNLRISHATAGMYLSLMSCVSFFSSPIIGKLSDQLGKRSHFLLLGSAGNCVGLLLCLTTQRSEVFILGRCFQAVFRCSNIIIGVCLSENGSPGDTSKLFATLAAVQAVAFIIGPIVGGYIASVNTRLPLAVAASLCFVNSYFNSRVESSLPKSKQVSSGNTERPWSLFPVWATSDYLIIFVVKVLSTFSQCVYESLFTQHMAHHLGLEGASNGWMLGYIGLITTISNAILVEPYSLLIDRWSHALPLAMVLHGIALIIWSQSNNTMVSMLASAITTVSFTAVSVYVQTLVILLCSSSNKGEIMGYVQSMERAAKTVAPFLGGFMLQNYGTGGLALVAAAPSIACAMFCIPFPVKRRVCIVSKTNYGRGSTENATDASRKEKAKVL